MNKKIFDIPNKLFLLISYILTIYIISNILAIILYGVLLNFYPNNPNNENFAVTLTNLLCYALLVFIFLFTLNKYFYREFQTFKKNFITFMGIAIAGWILNIFLNILVEIIMNLIDFVQRNSQNQEAIIETLKYPLIAIPMIVIGAPIVEEVIFRGVIFNFARNLKLPYKLNIILGFFLSSTLFGLIHVFIAYIVSGDTTELILGIPYVVAGFSLTLVYYLSKNIFVPITMHFIQNLFAVISILLLDLIPTNEIPVKTVQFINDIINLL